MKKVLFAALFAALVLASTANAEVIECPKLFPSKDITLSEVPLGHKGNARVQRAHLSLAYMYVGELYGEQYLVGPDVRNSKGGMDIEHGFRPEDTKWLVCRYGGNEWSRSEQGVSGTIEWWEKLDPKITSCVLKIREIKVPHTTSDWTATTTCKSEP
ncbi:MAG TPA: STY0301 family protein [Janthinobacterium sp.]|nr:STY0301 family protein [Janthinobacterium sp.]